jgi:4-hydroxy-tetrahydrodipicolinate reductase
MTQQLPVAVLGAGGRMGSEAVKAIEAAGDLQLVAALRRGDSLDTLVSAGARYVVDLTVPDSTETNVRFAVEHGMHAVVGTTGWDAGRLEKLRALLAERPDVGVLIAPNFALGSVLATAFAARAARYFESVEIIELHHPDKVDAPSGTAARTAELIAASRTDAGLPASPDATASERAGARGCEVDGVRVHSVRLRGLVAHQEVLLGGAGEQLTIRHDSFDRASFMPGVLLGIRQAASHPGLTVGLDGYLDLNG